MIGHYVRRFFTSLNTRPPSAHDEAWVETIVTPGELALFRRLSDTDRRHLVHSARVVETALGADADPVWVRAALLHDVGKYDAHLGVFGRVFATVIAAAAGADRIAGWTDRAGWRARVGRYQSHGELGAEQIRAVGGSEAAAVWSELHHHPERFVQSSIPRQILTVLDRADH